MNKKQNNKIRSDKEWRLLIEECRKSGLSKAQFCRQKGLHNGTFYTWNKALAVDKEDVETSKFIPITVKNCNEEIGYEIKSALLIESRDGLKIEFKNGCKIRDIKVIAEILRCY
jgi:hypothetical protein